MNSQYIFEIKTVSMGEYFFVFISSWSVIIFLKFKSISPKIFLETVLRKTRFGLVLSFKKIIIPNNVEKNLKPVIDHFFTLYFK